MSDFLATTGETRAIQTHQSLPEPRKSLPQLRLMLVRIQLYLNNMFR